MNDQLVSWRTVTDGVIWRIVGDEVIVMHLAPGQYFALRGVGGTIWQLLAEAPRSKDDLVRELSAQYEVGVDTLLADIERFLAALSGAALVTPTVP